MFLLQAAHDPRPSLAGARGFTLIELLVTVTIAAILLAAAMPSFTTVVNTNRLAALSNDIMASLQTARMEAIRRGVPLVVCGSDNGTTCASATRWKGWIVFTNPDDDGDPSGGEILRYDTVGTNVELWVSPAISLDNRIRFRPDGFAYDSTGVLLNANLAACIRTTTPAENARDVGIRAGTRFALAKRDADGACAAPGNS